MESFKSTVQPLIYSAVGLRVLVPEPHHVARHEYYQHSTPTRYLRPIYTIYTIHI